MPPDRRGWMTQMSVGKKDGTLEVVNSDLLGKQIDTYRIMDTVYV